MSQLFFVCALLLLLPPPHVIYLFITIWSICVCSQIALVYGSLLFFLADLQLLLPVGCSQWTKIRKNVQFREASVFVAEANNLIFFGIQLLDKCLWGNFITLLPSLTYPAIPYCTIFHF